MGGQERHRRRREKINQERLTMIFFFFLVRVSQAVSPSTMKPVTQPANKPTSPFHSAGPLARDQVMPWNKELLSCITSPQRGCSFLSPGSASPQHMASTGLASPPPAPIISHHYTHVQGGASFQLHKKSPLHVAMIINERLKATKHTLKIIFHLIRTCDAHQE